MPILGTCKLWAFLQQCAALKTDSACSFCALNIRFRHQGFACLPNTGSGNLLAAIAAGIASGHSCLASASNVLSLNPMA